MKRLLCWLGWHRWMRKCACDITLYNEWDEPTVCGDVYMCECCAKQRVVFAGDSV